MKKAITKRILLIFLVFNLIMCSIFPTTTQAGFFDWANVVGGKLFQPFFELLCGIGDLGMSMLQNFFIGYGDITESTIETSNVSVGKERKFYYSPAVIFSNRVPALDVNFINPMDDYTLTIEKNDKEPEKIAGSETVNFLPGQKVDMNKVEQKITDMVGKYGYDKGKRKELSAEAKAALGTIFTTGDLRSATVYTWTYDENGDGEQENYYIIQELNQNTASNKTYILTAYRENTQSVSGETKVSSAKILQNTVATWYRVLRTVALVGLLSVLVYIGIRIIISSTGEDKARYKKMINNWVAALCLLFVLHYIMAGVLWITEEITNVFSVNILDENGVDEWMSGIRNRIGDETPDDFSDVFADTIIYLALVFLTFLFTFKYLKRLLYMAFFTMIAPLIALTYPIDKIKDGQAQAFTTWIREYVFNALIQVIHLILYFMLITSAVDLTSDTNHLFNSVYAIVAIGFMIPAEKFFKKLFGFNQAETVGELGAAAGGALVMNAINKMGQKAGKEAEAKESKPPKFFGSSPADKVLGSPAPVRTNIGETSPESGEGTGGGNPAPGGGNSVPGGGNPAPGGGNSVPGGGNPAQGGGNSASGGGNQAGEATGGNSGMWGNLGRTELNRKKLWKEVVPSKFRKLNAKKGEIAKKALKKSAGVALGVTAGMVGLGVGVATGDLSNVAKYAGAGAAAGYLGGSGLAGSAIKKGENIKTSYREDFYSPEAKAILDNTDALWKNPDIRGLYEGKSKKKLQEDVNEFVTLGVTDKEKIAAAMKLKISHNINNSTAARVAALESGISDSAYGNAKNRAEYQEKIKASLVRYSQDPTPDKTAQTMMTYIDELKRNYNS